MKYEQYKKAKHYLLLVEEILEKTTLVYEKLLIDLLEGILLVKTKENDELGQRKIEKVTDIFSYVQLSDMIEMIIKEVNLETVSR